METKQRKTKQTEVGSISPAYTKLVDLIDECRGYVEKYGPTCRIVKTCYGYGDGEEYLAVVYDRPETDEEMQRRVIAEAVSQQEQENIEREVFERLKTKYG